MEVKVEVEQVAKIRNPAKFLQWSTFLQLEAPISFRLLSCASSRAWILRDWIDSIILA